MKEQAIAKINKIGKISSVLALIGKIFVGMGLVLVLIGTIICFMIPKEMVTVTSKGSVEIVVDLNSIEGTVISDDGMNSLSTQIQESIEADGMENIVVSVAQGIVNIAGDYEAISFSMRDMNWLLVLGLATLAMTFITLHFISSLCKAFRDCQSPFEDNVIKKMQHFAYSLLPWALLSTVTNSISDSFRNNGISLTLTVDLGVVLIVLVVLVLVHIFKYGAVLQQESDETL